ncbi:MAG: hypothetical protein JSU70_03935, partial [Phycisphaerales bacterium]
NVLGDETESLRLARQQLDELIRQVDEEVARAGGRSRQRQLSDSNAPGEPAANQQGRDTAQSAAGSRSPDGAQPQAREGDGTITDAGGRADPQGWGGGPLTGDDYTQWSDRLRDVEEILSEQDLRDEAARVRERARATRAEFKRHGKEPQWDLVRQQIMDPLVELREHVSDKLAQLQSDEALVRIDRDPVPDRFSELVRRYFENLGDEN